jgi:hypothetical protein
MLQVGYQISLFRFGICSNNGSKSNLNSPGWRTSPDPLLVLQSHCRIVNASGRTLNFPLQTWNLPKKWVLGQLEWTWLEGVTWPAPGGPNDYFGYSECYSENIKLPFSDLESAQKMGLCMTWMDLIRGCHLTCSWCSNHVLGYSECYR